MSVQSTSAIDILNSKATTVGPQVKKTYAQANGGSYSWSLDDDFGDDEDSEDDFEDHLYSVPDPPRSNTSSITPASPSHDGDNNADFSDSSLDWDSDDEHSYFSHIRHTDFPATAKRQSPITTPEESDNVNVSDFHSDSDSDEEVPSNFNLVNHGFCQDKWNGIFPPVNQQADEHETKQKGDQQAENGSCQSNSNSASSQCSDNVPDIGLNNLDEDGDDDEDDDSPCFPDSHFASSSAPVMETGFEDDEEVPAHTIITIPRLRSSDNISPLPYSPSLETIEEECCDNDPEPTILEDNNSNEQTALQIKKRGTFDFIWADEDEGEDDYDHIYSYDGPPNAYNGPANFDNQVDSSNSATLDSDALDDITHLIKEDEAHDIDIAEVHRPSSVAKFNATLSEADAVINLANALITDLTTINEAMAILRQERFAKVKCQLKPDSLYGKSQNCCAWELYPIAFQPESLTTPYDNYPTPFLCVTDPEGQTYNLEERLWEMSRRQLDDFIERDERHRHMQPFVLQHRDVDETYEQYERALIARRYWADCMEQDELDRFWAAARERAAKSEPEEEREAKEEENNSHDENVNEKPSNEANAWENSENTVDNDSQFGGSEPEMSPDHSPRAGGSSSDPETYAESSSWVDLEEDDFSEANEPTITSQDKDDYSDDNIAPPPTPQLTFSDVTKTSSVLSRLEAAKEVHCAAQQKAEQRAADQALFNAKFGWIWSIRHVVSLLINTNQDSLTAKEMRFFDPLKRYIPCLRPPVYINLKMLSNWLRDGRPIQGRRNEDLFGDFYEMIIDYGPEARAVNTYMQLCVQSNLAGTNPRRDAQIEEQWLRMWEQEIVEEGTGKDGELMVWDMGRECFSVVVRDNRG